MTPQDKRDRALILTLFVVWIFVFSALLAVLSWRASR